MPMIEMPMLIAMLMLNTVPPRPVTPPTDHCSGRRVPDGFDCCLHLAIWNGQSTLSSTFTSTPRTRADDERTIQDVTKR
ncbi:hypothetical protein D9M73_72890 [compost metagenome]|jgi:hypothetical protein